MDKKLQYPGYICGDELRDATGVPCMCVSHEDKSEAARQLLHDLAPQGCVEYMSGIPEYEVWSVTKNPDTRHRLCDFRIKLDENGEVPEAETFGDVLKKCQEMFNAEESPLCGEGKPVSIVSQSPLPLPETPEQQTTVSEFVCPYCGSTRGVWFDRTVDVGSGMCDRCIACGKDVAEVTSKEHVKDESPVEKLIAEARDNGDTGLDLDFTKVTDLTPLKGMPLKVLTLDYTKVTDLTTLEWMPLKWLYLYGTNVTDLSPLEGMPLKRLDLDGTNVKDLTPLKGMPLKWLTLSFTKVTDLTPLKGMPLEGLYLSGTNVTDLSPLEGMPLKVLYLSGTKVTDLTPLKGMPLEGLHLFGTKVTDLTPLKGMPLEGLTLSGTPAAKKPLPEWLNNVMVYL